MRQSLFGKIWCDNATTIKDKSKLLQQNVLQKESTNQLLEASINKFQLSQKFSDARQKLIEILVNLEVSQVLISDIKSKDHNKFKLIYDFDKDYQTYLESQFVFWKFLALVKYSQLDLEHYGFSSDKLELLS